MSFHILFRSYWVVEYIYFSKMFILKGECHKIFCFWFSSWISFPPAPEYPIRTVSNFFENSRRYSQVKVHHRYQRHRWQICHRCQRHRRQNCRRYQRHRRQILPPVSLVLLIPVANLQWWAKWRFSTFDLYPWGEAHGVQVQICDIRRPQLAMNRFLPLWPRRFPHFVNIHLGGGGVGRLWY